MLKTTDEGVISLSTRPETASPSCTVTISFVSATRTLAERRSGLGCQAVRTTVTSGSTAGARRLTSGDGGSGRAGAVETGGFATATTTVAGCDGAEGAADRGLGGGAVLAALAALGAGAVAWALGVALALSLKFAAAAMGSVSTGTAAREGGVGGTAAELGGAGDGTGRAATSAVACGCGGLAGAAD